MSVLAPTPRDRLLWDDATTLETFRTKLRDPDPAVRAYFIGKLMRQAPPDVDR